MIRAAAVGWTPVADGPLPTYCHRHRPPACVTDRRLTFNVSGRHFQISCRLLEPYPDTLLGSDEKEYFYDIPSAEYVFDRDPQLFRLVLVYYQTGRLHYPRHQCVAAFDAELQFFGIQSDVVADCCYEGYRDRRQDLVERSADHLTPEEREKQRQVPASAPLRQRMWRGFEFPQTSTAGTVFYYVTGFFIAVSVVANIAETVRCSDSGRTPTETCGERFNSELFCMDTACVLSFNTELFCMDTACVLSFNKELFCVDTACVLLFNTELFCVDTACVLSFNTVLFCMDTACVLLFNTELFCMDTACVLLFNTELFCMDTACVLSFNTELFCMDTACVLLFTVEYALRLYAAPSRCRYALSVMSAVDIAAVLPYYVAL